MFIRSTVYISLRAVRGNGTPPNIFANLTRKKTDLSEKRISNPNITYSFPKKYRAIIEL